MYLIGSLLTTGIFLVGLVVIGRKIWEWREDAIRYYESLDNNLE